MGRKSPSVNTQGAEAPDLFVPRVALDARAGRSDARRKSGEEGVGLDKALLIQLSGSAAAVVLLVGLAAWAGVPRPAPPLDPAGARALLAQEFPDDRIEALWIAADRAGAVARSGDLALVLWRKGDGYVARAAPLAEALNAAVARGRVRLRGVDGSPRLALDDGAWPPPEFVSSELAP